MTVQPPLRVLIVDDTRLARQELRTCWRNWGGVECIGEADDVPAAQAAIEKLRPDLVLLMAATRVWFRDQCAMLARSLSALESRLDPAVFFRVNRNTRVNLRAVRGVELW